MTQKRTATLFIDKNSWLERLHPLTKLSYVFLMGVVVYAGPRGWKYTALLLLLNCALIFSGNLLKETCTVLGRIMLPLLLFMLPIHAFLNPDNQTALCSLNKFTVYREGVVFALTTLSKLAVILLSSLLFVLSTHPADLISSISQNGRTSLAYLVGSPLLLLAGMRERIATIRGAQCARGLHTDGNLLQRCCSVAPLIVPLVIGALVEVEQRSIALEVRGFKSRTAKTSLRVVADSISQRFFRWLTLPVCTALFLYRCIW